MATILAKMDGDTVGPALLRFERGFDHRRFDAAAGLAQGRDMVDVNA